MQAACCPVLILCSDSLDCIVLLDIKELGIIIKDVLTYKTLSFPQISQHGSI